MTDQNINITLDQGSTSESHGWQVLGTLLGCGALGMGAWALSNAGLLDLAATGLTMFGFQLVRMMFAAGIIALPQGNGEKSFRETSGFLKVASREFAEWQAKSPIWRLAALALAYTVGFLFVRWGISVGLGIFHNIFIAGAVSMLIAAVIVAPRLFSGLGQKLKKTAAEPVHEVAEDEEEK